MLPEWMTSFWLRITTLFRRRQLERDLDDELQFHLAMREQKAVPAGIHCKTRSVKRRTLRYNQARGLSFTITLHNSSFIIRFVRL